MPYFDVRSCITQSTFPTGQTQLNIIVAMNDGAGLRYTVRSNQPIAWQPGSPTGPRQWKPWPNLETETGYTDGGSFVAACAALANARWLSPG